jgi:hypothetical protein
MRVKDTRPQLLDDLPTGFALAPIAGEQRTVSETLARGPGRLEQRRRHTSIGLVGYRAWPGLAQVCQGERQILRQKTGEVRDESVPMRGVWWRWCGGTGRLQTHPIGSGMGRLMKSGRQCGGALCLK